MDARLKSADNGITPTLTPEALLAQIQLEVPKGAVTIKGIVSNLRYWSPSSQAPPKRCYGHLALGDAAIRFQVPAEATLHEGEAVVMHGCLRVNALLNNRATHEVDISPNGRPSHNVENPAN